VSAAPTPPPAGCGCITCGDEALPMRVARVDTGRGLALCEDDAGARASVEIALVEPVAPGDVLLVHAGTAIARGTAA
jgi:hydrogenase expression/formation protein HypC